MVYKSKRSTKKYHSFDKMKVFLVLVVASFAFVRCDQNPELANFPEPDLDLHPDIREDARLTTIELVHKYGYPGEIHTFTTTDGYNLELHRIPGSPVSPPAAGKPVAFVMHGMLSSSADFVLMGPNTAVAYMLADRGYDVWMGNARGNRYSRSNVNLDVSSAEFWDFSWHEIGLIDVPQSIDFVLGVTGEEKVHYIGHSQGTTVFWVMCIEHPEYNDKFYSANLLAPSAYMHNTRSPYVLWLATWLYTTQWALHWMGTHYFSPTDEMNILAGEQQCRDGAPFQEMCANEIFLLAGWNSAELNRTMLPVINGHSPAGAATNQMIHYGQVTRHWRFHKFDHGWVKNMQLYGQMLPPNYNLRGVTLPVALYHSTNDWLAAPRDVNLLARDLPNVDLQYLVPQTLFNHMDFIWAINQRSLVHERMIQYMDEKDPRM